MHRPPADQPSPGDKGSEASEQRVDDEVAAVTPDPVEATGTGDERVRQLRQQVAAGEYHPDAEAIARRMLERGDLRELASPDDDGTDGPDSGPRLVEEAGEPGAAESGA